MVDKHPAVRALDDALETLRTQWTFAKALDECPLLRAQIEHVADGIHRARRELVTTLTMEA